QLSYSLRFIANAWGWDVCKVRRFCVRLVNDNMVVTATDTGQILITGARPHTHTHGGRPRSGEGARAAHGPPVETHRRAEGGGPPPRRRCYAQGTGPELRCRAGDDFAASTVNVFLRTDRGQH